MERHQSTLTAYQEENWRALLEIEMILLTETVTHNENYHYSYAAPNHPSRFTSETQLAYFRWLSERDIMPVLPIEYSILVHGL